ncbi:DUF637 domain-containing protein [Endozoicomonas arenosclerae]|uniref:DUF637 domain-containing protein n=1 Tax=Endozoicomonas arenosclerae TaxID=1633495 RepID=UPI000780E600|nr:DUF637 domain-containing protein [Endozoicomonas arenosclerae]
MCRPSIAVHLLMLAIIALFFIQQAQCNFYFNGHGEGVLTSDDGGFVDIIATPQGTILRSTGNIRIENAEIYSDKPIRFQAPESTVSLTRTQVKAQSISITALALHLLATRQAEEWQTVSKKRGVGSKRTAVHTEHHSRLSATLLEAAERIQINTQTLISEAAYLKAGTGIDLNAKHWLALAGVESHFVQDEVRRKGLVRNKHKVSGQQWTNVVHTRIDAPEVNINVQTVEAQIGIVTGESLAESLERLVTAYPELTWLNTVKENDTHWQTIETSYKNWRQKQSGLSPLAGIVIGAAVTVATYGAGASFLPAGFSANLMATNAANAAFSSLVARSSVAIVNHGGNISAAMDEVFSKGSLQSVGVEVLAGALMGGFDVPYSMTPEAPLAVQIHNAAVRVPTRAVSESVIKGGSLGKSLETAATTEVYSELAAQLNYWAGSHAQQQGWQEGSPEKVALHAATGAAYGLLKEGKPLAGAAAGAAAQAVSRVADYWIDVDECWDSFCPPEPPEIEKFSLTHKEQEELYSKVLEVLSTVAAAVAAQMTEGYPETGVEIAQAQYRYNRQLHSNEVGRLWQKIESLSSEEQDRYKAAACFLTQCSQGVHPSDDYYSVLKRWQETGAQFGQEIWTLQATGLFLYSNVDGWKDAIKASRATAVAHIILAGIEGVGFVTADVMAISVGNMPLAAALWTAGTYVSGETLNKGIDQLQGRTGEGQRVMDSYRPDTHPGDESLLESFAPLSDLAVEGLTAGAGGAMGAGVKLLKVVGQGPISGGKAQAGNVVADSILNNLLPSGDAPGVKFANKPLDGSKVGRTENCVNCVVVGDVALEGRYATALPSDGPVPGGLIKLQEHFASQNGGDIFRYIPLKKVDAMLLKSGDGARGVVYVQWKQGGAHVFNAVNDKGVIKYLDPQTGGLQDLSAGIKSSGTAFMRTNTNN